LDGFDSATIREGMYDRQAMTKALISRNWSAVVSLLPHGVLLNQFLEDIEHTGCLIHPRDDAAGRAGRDRFLANIRQHLQEHGSGQLVADLESHIRDVRIIERCFHEIRKALKQIQISQRSPEEQAWAAIDRFIGELRHLHERMNAALKEKSSEEGISFLDSDPWTLKGDTGMKINPDAVVASLARQLALTLTMLAFENDWFSGRTLNLPERVPTSDNLQFESGSNSLLAHCWTEVEDGSEHVRYFGTKVVEERAIFQSPDSEKTIEADMVRFDIHYVLQYWEIVARERFARTVLQNSSSIHNSRDVKGRIKNPRHEQMELIPVNFMSSDEAIVHMILIFIFRLPVSSPHLYKGLLLTEWMRGYAVLQRLAHEEEGNLSILEFEPDQLHKILVNAGLTAEKAKIFLDEATFQRGKRDLYDAPLLRSGSGRLFFLAPLYIGATLWDIILSQLGSLRESVGLKGQIFEQEVRSLFDEKGVPARSFKYKIGDQVFQVDLAVLWDRKLFVFECKNDVLPGSRPSQSYYFWQDMLSAAEQVTRIAEQLTTDDSIIKSHFGPNAEWDEVHPIVLNAIPFSLPDKINGAFFYDASALQRFFKEGRLGIIQESKGSDGQTVFTKVPLQKLWAGDSPTANDLIEQLQNPAQLTSLKKRANVDWIKIGISNDFVLVTPALRLTAVGFDDVLSSLGVASENATALKEELAKIADSVSGQGPL
jgi:hypothetical protein